MWRQVCSVPLLRQDLEKVDVGLWRYYAQVTDGTTSYGGYSACPPNEKITWGKLAPDTPSYVSAAPLLSGFSSGEERCWRADNRERCDDLLAASDGAGAR